MRTCGPTPSSSSTATTGSWACRRTRAGNRACIARSAICRFCRRGCSASPGGCRSGRRHRQSAPSGPGRDDRYLVRGAVERLLLGDGCDRRAFALERGYVVLVASPPTVTPAHHHQQESLGALLMRQFGAAARFKYSDLGSSIDLSDPEPGSPDGVHRTELGNHEVAQRIATSLLRWSASPGRRSR